MKPRYLLPLVAALFCTPVLADDFAYAFEGDATKRERLKSLQGSETPPELQVSGWQNGDAVTLEDLKGKIVVLDFWATWCGPCIMSIPHNNEIAEKYKDDVVFIGVCHTRGSENMADVAKEKDIRYPIAIDKDQATINAYGVNSYPDYYVIDQTGRLVVADCLSGELERVLDQLLSK